MRGNWPRGAVMLVLAILAGPGQVGAQTLEALLASEGVNTLARAAREQGDPGRGAIVFHRAYLACARCHATGQTDGPPRLGPDLARLDAKEATDAYLVESVLFPSKVIRKGFEAVTIATADGRTVTGTVAADGPDRVVLRVGPEPGQTVAIDRKDIVERVPARDSMMPAGQVSQLPGRGDFVDLIRYLIEIRDGGPARARALQPTEEQLAVVLPEYESRVDHAGLIDRLNRKSYERGEAIYHRHCINCHGTREQAGSLPTSLAFATGRFKNGFDPLAMYQTLTRGHGMMAPQTWMVPQQKYDVIHYIREAYLKPHNPSQYRAVNAAYLSALPKGNTRGPEPKVVEPWRTMDYGPSLINTYEVGSGGSNFAYKGIAVRLDAGPGGVARGRAWMVFDHDTMRMAAAWTGSEFIDWNGIQFNGRHQVHPRIAGDVHVANPTGPGWADPETGRFDDDRRVRGRDGRRYGPLPASWARYRGLHHDGPREIVAYSVGATDVLESPGLATTPKGPVFLRTFHLGARPRALVLQVAKIRSEGTGLIREGDAVTLGALAAGLSPPVDGAEWIAPGDGNLHLRLPAGDRPLKFTLWTARVPEGSRPPEVHEPARDLSAAVRAGGAPRWPMVLATDPAIGRDDGPFAVDLLTPPENNPWLAQTRLTGIDFFDGGDRAAVSSWDGDVWVVSGLNSLPATAAKAGRLSARLTWHRIASGLFQPLGVKVIRDVIHVTCRDQLAILRDTNGDGETDFVECLNNDHQVTEHFHEFAMGLQVDGAGNFYYAKSARHALPAVVPHHGTLLKISPDGARTDIIATGFRAANGVCLNPDGTFFVTDQEGHWTPKNRINLVKPGHFYGNMFGYHEVTDTSDAAMEQPLCWITNEFDRSPGELLWVEGSAWSPLEGALLNLSYGHGRVYVVLREEVDGMVQGGVSPLPIPTFPTGIMRGRFHPLQGQLYACGLFAWAGNQQYPGGFYRIRRTGKPLWTPIGLHARADGLQVTFTGPLDRSIAAQADRYSVATWSLRRTAEYGSKHHDEKTLAVTSARVSDDGRTVFLAIPEIQPTQGMAIRYQLKGPGAEEVSGVIHNTIHALGR